MTSEAEQEKPPADLAKQIAYFEDATPVARCGKWIVTNGGGPAYFELHGTDGKVFKFMATPSSIAEINHSLWHLTALSARSKPIENSEHRQLRFDTSHFIASSGLGSDANGHVTLHLFTTGGLCFETTFGPVFTADLASTLQNALAMLPNPPPILDTTPPFFPKTQGIPPKGTNTETHFGQEYDSGMLKIVGLMIIRANLLEESLVKLLAALLVLPMQRAEALFYSSSNMKARMDMIRAASATSDLGTVLESEVGKQLEKVDRVSRRRNQLVHGEWSFKNDKFSVRERKPLPRTKKQDAIESFASVEQLVTEFFNCTVGLNLLVHRIHRARVNADGEAARPAE